VPLDLSLFDKAYRLFKEKGIKVFTSLQGSSKALFFCKFTEPCILLSASVEKAQRLYDDAIFWSKALQTDEPLFIRSRDDLLRSGDIMRVYTEAPKKVITSIDSALLPLWKKDEYPSMVIRKGWIIGRDDFITRLDRLGYRRVPVVSREGEMSIRAGIIDVFPPYEQAPVRIEFFGDSIESIRSFDIDTQLSIKEVDSTTICPIIEPSEGPNLVELLDTHLLILDEPDDIRRESTGYEEIINESIFMTSLPLKGNGLSLDIKGVAGLGILPEERGTIEDFIKGIRVLKRRYFTMLVCASEGQAKRLIELFSDDGLDVALMECEKAIQYMSSPVITIGNLSSGFRLDGCMVLTESDIFGRRPVVRTPKRSRVSSLISTIEEFKEGDYLVHIEHGIGRFVGIKKQRVEDYEGDFISIEYLGGDMLYVPLERIDCIQKYHAPEGAKPRLDRLGGKTWQKTKERVRKRIKEMAKELLTLYAKRATIKGHAFSPDTELHREFDTFFIYEETPDQLNAIAEIKKDMERDSPMERLLCGDVGYGKTEVAMRAAFKAVYDSKQVAVLVPTTILAEQHYNTFRSRFAAFPVRIEMLSRFLTRAEQSRILHALARGDIDIIIGTHRLLGKDVKFHNLGLLIIDEEHRFGVAHKERIKDMKAHVDVLTMTATPIPRTLHMALSGIRAMSVIETPPEERLAVHSIVTRFDPDIIRDALVKELKRGGQAFFLHNRIQDIYEIADFLKRLVPEARIGVAHGQMKAKELEKVMTAFYRGEMDILVTTAIIGSGIDIPTANTIIINRADRFGLADLYQLRGRVGRSNIKAYAYFLIPGEDAITEDARKRLMAIQELSYLGAGLRLAMKDLEIRGAGNLLGPEQSGHIEAVGYDLYIKMLEEAISELKGEEIKPTVEPHIEMRVTARVPEDYIEDPTLRLSIYRKIASANNRDTLRMIRDELEDRFGRPPHEVLRLLDVMELKMMARELLITKIQGINGRVKILFSDNTPITPEQLYGLYKKRTYHIRFLPEGGIEVDLKARQRRGPLHELKAFLNILLNLRS
jgi:transcription-repair coupling factor (superfamily II helicase)